MIDTVWLDPIPNPPGYWLRGMEAESMSRPSWKNLENPYRALT